MGLLDGKIALITGATRGIGRATAITFAKEGCELILNGTDENRLFDLSEEIESLTKKKPLVFPYDVAKLDEIKNTFKAIRSHYKSIDILVNNAGVLQDALIGMINPKQIEETMSVNLYAVMYHMQYASRLMVKNKSGSIINVSSIIGTTGNEGQVVYAASKAGVIGATRSAAKELSPLGIRVNAVSPGFIETDMTSSLPENKYKERLANIKMNRIGQPYEVANTILFLASDLSSYVTGQVIGVDGGMVV